MTPMKPEDIVRHTLNTWATDKPARMALEALRQLVRERDEAQARLDEARATVKFLLGSRGGEKAVPGEDYESEGAP
jgi:hypothetical protein